MSDDELLGEELPFPLSAGQILMRSAIAAGAAGRRLAVDRRGVFHLTPREWAQLDADTRVDADHSSEHMQPPHLDS